MGLWKQTVVSISISRRKLGCLQSTRARQDKAEKRVQHFSFFHVSPGSATPVFTSVELLNSYPVIKLVYDNYDLE